MANRKQEIEELLRQIKRNHEDAESGVTDVQGEISELDYQVGLGDLEFCPDPKDGDEARDSVRDCERAVSDLQDIVYKLEELSSSLQDCISNIEELQGNLEELGDLFDEDEEYEEGDRVVFTSGVPAGIHEVLSAWTNGYDKQFVWVILNRMSEPVSAPSGDLERSQ